MSTSPTTHVALTPAQDIDAVRKAISFSPRPRPPGPLSAAVTFGWRGMLKVEHVPEQLVDVTITPVMFVLLFTYMFGGAVAGSTGEYRDSPPAGDPGDVGAVHRRAAGSISGSKCPTTLDRTAGKLSGA